MAETEEARLHLLDYWRVIRVRWMLVLVVFLLVLITAAIVTALQPRTYRSSVFIEVKSMSENPRMFGSDLSIPYHDPQLAPTVFQVIQRTGILYPVIDDLKLRQKWSRGGYTPSREQAYQMLRNELEVDEVRNTDLLQVSVYDSDPQIAADIANKIVAVYQEKRVEEEHDVLNRAVGSMNEEVAKQDKKVQEAAAEVSRIREREHIVDLNPEGTEDALAPVNQNVVKQEAEVNDAEAQVATLKAKLQQIENVKGDELMRMLPTLNIQDPVIQKILPNYQDAVAMEAQLLHSGLGENHPRVKAVRASKDVYMRQLEQQIATVRDGLERNLRSAQATRDALKRGLDDINKNQLAAKNLSANYTRAKNAYIKERTLLDNARIRAQSETMEMAMPRQAVSVKQVAEPSAYPARPRVFLNLALGGVVGLLLGVGLAFFIEYLDTSVKTMQDVESLLNVPVLAIIPQNAPLLSQEQNAPDTEAYRILRTNIELNRGAEKANVISFVSGGPGEGKSTTLANLAVVTAQAGNRTLVVDTDLRRPSQHSLFGLQNDIGLTNYLTTDTLLEECIRSTNVPNLSLITSGAVPVDPAGLLNSKKMKQLIEQLKGRYDFVFCDSPPILGVSDASVLASEVDRTVIVVQHRRFPRSMLTRVQQAIQGAGGRILGVVLNNVDLRHDQTYYFHTSYYAYQQPRAVRPKVERRARSAAPAGNGASESEEY